MVLTPEIAAGILTAVKEEYKMCIRDRKYSRRELSFRVRERGSPSILAFLVRVSKLIRCLLYTSYRQALDQQLALKKQALSPVLEISDTAFIIRMLEKNLGKITDHSVAGPA